MMNELEDYIDKIKAAVPDQEIRSAVINRDGMVNVAVIINEERVFRFPRDRWAGDLMRHEMKVLDLITPRVDLEVPHWDIRSNEMVSYRYISGEPLLTDDLIRMSDRDQEGIAEQIGRLLTQLHTTPQADLDSAGIELSDTVRSTGDWLDFYGKVETELFPLMWADGREWVRRHFAPVLSDPSLLDYEPRLMSGDLATYHLLFDPDRNRLKGVIDFGTAGLGDPAADFATLINQYGETFLKRVAHYYPNIEPYILRSRFWAGTLELQWVLRGILRNQPDMFVVHLGRARDMRPVDSGW